MNSPLRARSADTYVGISLDPAQPLSYEELHTILDLPFLAERDPLLARLAGELARRIPPPGERLIQDNVAQQYWLAHRLGLDPEAVHQRLQHDRANADYLPPGAYSVQGVEKAAQLLRGLDQCHELARRLEADAGAPDHLTLTLRHLYVHLALLVGEYEKQVTPFTS